MSKPQDDREGKETIWATWHALQTRPRKENESWRGKNGNFFFPFRVSVGSILDLSSTGKEEMDLRGTVGSD